MIKQTQLPILSGSDHCGPASRPDSQHCLRSRIPSHYAPERLCSAQALEMYLPRRFSQSGKLVPCEPLASATDLPPLRLNLGRDEPEILKECRDGRTRETSRMERCAVLTLSSRPKDTLGIAIIVHTWKRLTTQQHKSVW